LLLWWAAIRRPRAPANELQSRCSRPFAGSDTHVAAGGHGRGAACTRTPFSINITPQLTHKIAAPRDKRRLLRAAATTNTPLLVRGSRASLKVSERSSYLPEGRGIQRGRRRRGGGGAAQQSRGGGDCDGDSDDSDGGGSGDSGSGGGGGVPLSAPSPRRSLSPAPAPVLASPRPPFAATGGLAGSGRVASSGSPSSGSPSSVALSSGSSSSVAPSSSSSSSAASSSSSPSSAASSSGSSGLAASSSGSLRWGPCSANHAGRRCQVYP